MIKTLVTMSVQNRWLVIVFTLVMAVVGLYIAKHLPLDAVPDITNTQVQINTEADGYTPLEVEQRITFLIENALFGIPQLDYTRSISRYGLSQITIIFKEGTDIYWARQQLSERLQSIRSSLPTGLEPALGPISSGLGEIFTYVVTADKNARKTDGTVYSVEDLRIIQDWVIRPQMVKVSGITEINTVGGFERQYQVEPDPKKMLAFKVTMQQVIEAVLNNNQNVGAGYIEKNGEQWLVRSVGQLNSIEDIGKIVVARIDNSIVTINDVADVVYGKQLRTGAATSNGEEAVLGTAFMLLGENSRTVAKAVAKKLKQVNLSLPIGIEAKALYDRTSLVDKTIATVQKNLLEGSLIVIVILFLFLGNVRAALITALIIPLSMLFAITGMATNRVSGNLMSLGAIDFGLIVDGAVIVTENVLLRLSQQNSHQLPLAKRLEIVIKSTQEVIQPASLGVLIIMLVYLPIFALDGVEGKMFEPMAFTVVAALLGSLIFTVTFIPAAIAIFMKGKINQKENLIMVFLRKIYQPLLKLSLRFSVLVVVFALGLFTLSAIQISKIGTEFMPKLDESDIAMHALRITGTGIEQSVAMQKVLENELKKLPEVKYIFSKIGTPEIATDPMPPNVADTFLVLKPQEQWHDPSKTKQQFIADLRELISKVPANNYEITQPIEMRFNELITGVRTDIALRIYGDDLAILAKIGEQTSALLSTVAGSKDVRVEETQGLPMINVIANKDHLALLGLTMSEVEQAVQVAIGGVQVGHLYEGDRRFKIIIRLNKKYSQDLATLAKLPIVITNLAYKELAYVPLGDIAELKIIMGPSKINRESGKRNVVVTANVSDRDLGSFIAETKELMQQQLVMPAGYWLEYDGTFKQLQSATERLTIIVPIILLIIFGLLFTVFNSVKDAILIFVAIPLALTGGVLSLMLRDMPLSLSAMIGFIALSGISVLNGIVLITFISSLRKKGEEVLQAIKLGVNQRLRPVLMTALVASLGFVPMVISTGAGAEVQKPLATVVIGGIISSTILTLLVLPALYKIFYRVKS
jgi:cobalt-zinc-cadmium resistance protein CzcA